MGVVAVADLSIPGLAPNKDLHERAGMWAMHARARKREISSYPLYILTVHLNESLVRCINEMPSPPTPPLKHAPPQVTNKTSFALASTFVKG